MAWGRVRRGSRKSVTLNDGTVITVRSGSEARVVKDLDARGEPVNYEPEKIPFTHPARATTYTPDLVLKNGIRIEVKGEFPAKDREKLLLVREQHPRIDIRLVFDRLAQAIYPGSKTTHAMWCEAHGFKCAEKLIPQAWLKERKK